MVNQINKFRKRWLLLCCFSCVIVIYGYWFIYQKESRQTTSLIIPTARSLKTFQVEKKSNEAGKSTAIETELQRYMNLKVDPCDNFYEYACGNYTNHPDVDLNFPKFSVFKRIERNNMKKLGKLLETKTYILHNKNGSSAINKVQDYYTACRSVDQVQPFVKNALVKVIQSIQSMANDSLEHILARVHSMGFDSIFRISVDLNVRDTSQHIIVLDLPKSALTLPMYTGYNNTRNRNTFLNHVKSVSSRIGKAANIFIDNAKDLWKFEKKLGNLIRSSSTSAGMVIIKDLSYFKNVTNAMDYHTVNSNIKLTSRFLLPDINQSVMVKNLDATHLGFSPFQTGFYQFDYDHYLELVFPAEKISKHTRLSIFGLDYFKKLGDLLQKTSKRVLTTYIAWHSTVLTLKPLPAVQKFLFPIHHTLTKNLANNDRKERKEEIGKKGKAAVMQIKLPTKWQCVESTNLPLGFALTAIYVKEFLDWKYNDQLHNILKQIVETFQTYLNVTSHPWLHRGVLHLVKVRARYTQILEAYPEFIKSPQTLDLFYEKLNVTSHDPVQNYVNYLSWSKQVSFSKLNQPTNRSIWDTSPMEGNAYFSHIRNRVTFPISLVQSPLFSVERPSALNFGSTGFLIAHEITHGFDTHGRNYGKTGNYDIVFQNAWETSFTSQSFDKHRQCFVNQFNQFNIAGNRIDGVSTFNENLADNGGIAFALMAYKSWMKQSSHDYKERQKTMITQLNTTDAKLFFLAFAQTWCTHYTKEYTPVAIKYDSHTHAKYRVIGTLSNFASFSEAYSCPSGSTMNPVKKCVIW